MGIEIKIIILLKEKKQIQLHSKMSTMLKDIDGFLEKFSD